MRLTSISTLLLALTLGAHSLSEARANPKFFARRSISLHALKTSFGEESTRSGSQNLPKTPNSQKSRSPLQTRKLLRKIEALPGLHEVSYSSLNERIKSTLLLDQASLISQVCPGPFGGGFFRGLTRRTIYSLLAKTSFPLHVSQQSSEPKTESPGAAPVLISPRPTLADLDRVGLERLGLDRDALVGLRVVSPAGDGNFTDLSTVLPAEPNESTEQDKASSFKVDSYTTCLARLSTVWRVPAQVTGLFPFAGAIQPMTQHFVVMSTIKHIRSAIARAYFQTRGLKILEEETELTSLQINRWLVGYGFNRLFSEKNFMGATAASDVDFNILYNDRKIQDSQIQQKLRNAVFRMKKELAEFYSLELEVADFTIQPLSLVLNSIQARDESTLNFYATVLGHDVLLFGNRKLQKVLFDQVEAAIQGEDHLRIFKHYVGQETSKLSLGALLHIEELRQRAQEQGKDSRVAKLVSRYTEPTLGMPMLGVGPERSKVIIESKEVGQVFFPSKEIVRLWDFHPHDQQTQDLYLVVSRLQDLKIRRIDRKLSREFLVGLSQSEPQPLDLDARIRSFQRSTSEIIDRKYTAIRVRNFLDFARSLATKDGLKEVVEYACQKNLVHSICPGIQETFNLAQSELFEDLMNHVGFIFLRELVETSFSAARRLTPPEYGEL